jgi:hypothetical protein
VDKNIIGDLYDKKIFTSFGSVLRAWSRCSATIDPVASETRLSWPSRGTDRAIRLARRCRPRTVDYAWALLASVRDSVLNAKPSVSGFAASSHWTLTWGPIPRALKCYRPLLLCCKFFLQYKEDLGRLQIEPIQRLELY